MNKFLEDTRNATLIKGSEKDARDEVKRWLQCCEVIQGLDRLENLRIRLYYTSEILLETKFLEGLRRIEVPEASFIVELPWVSEKQGGDGFLENTSAPGNRVRCTVKRTKMPRRVPHGAVGYTRCRRRAKKMPFWATSIVVTVGVTVGVICSPIILCVFVGSCVIGGVQDARTAARNEKEKRRVRDVKREIAVRNREWMEAGCPEIRID